MDKVIYPLFLLKILVINALIKTIQCYKEEDVLGDNFPLIEGGYAFREF